MKQSKSIVTVNEHFGWSFSQHPVVNFSQTHLASVYMSSKEQMILDKITGVVGRTAPDAELYLYGSRARHEAKKMSDWDILILLNSQNVSFGFETRLMDEFYELEVETGEIISPIIYSKADWNDNRSHTPLFENIQREGIRIK